ncbi:MAG: hypothetical protein WC208_11045 [Gallionella sp.]|jgi:FtsP/CotA-like multicopper oxidase with cupredoxin domain
MSSQLPANVAHAGSGWGTGVNASNTPVMVKTYYANSPAGPVPYLDPATGQTVPALDPVTGLATGLPVVADTGKALRKFVDTLPGIPGVTTYTTPNAPVGSPAGANNLGQYIPVAVPEKNWTNPATGIKTTDDYYEIAAIEYSEKMHSDLVKATHLRGYVQLSTANNPGKHIALTYPNGSPVLDTKGVQVFAYDNPHHLGPIIQATSGTAVRVKFTNYLPVGGGLFIPVDTTITGAGLGPDGVTSYSQNRAEIHLVGGQSPWISAGSPHQWVAPAGETAAYAAGLGKGVSAKNVPDMTDPGAGSSTLYFPNTQSSRFMFYQDRTSGLTRLNAYAGLEAGYFITDTTEQGLIASGAIPADQIPLIIEDKTFVPANIAQQDAKWDTLHWGQPGDLWFPHVYETNQDPNSMSGVNPVGRWEYGPWFWPIFTATQPLPSGSYGNASFTPEAYEDTPLINGTAYPTLTVDPKAYRFRILNASNDRYINLGLYKADTTAKAPQLDQNGNPIVDANGNQLYFANTEVKMVPAMADAAGNPLTPSNTGAGLAYDPTCLCQYPTLPQLQPSIAFSGPTRAWPSDGRISGVPDPTAVGPDFIAIGNDGGLLPLPVDIPSQPVTYEQNRRSITVMNIYGYGLLLGPAERSDVIVDFSAYAGQTLILYNDAPAPVPFNDPRVDYYTGAPDLTSTGGTYGTKPGYGPNTRTMMQIKVNAAPVAATGTFNANALLTALPAAYAASQPAPIVPQSAYNAAFKTNDADTYAHVATGSIAQPNLNFTTTGTMTITGLSLITSGGTRTPGGTIIGNAIPGSGGGYMSAPIVNFNNGACLPAGVPSAEATAVVNATTHQVTAVNLVNPLGYPGYTCAPSITFTPTTNSGVISNIGLANSGSGYTAPTVTITGGGTGATATASTASPVSSIVTVLNGGSGYTAPTVTISGGGGTGAAATATVGSTPVSSVAMVSGGAGYTAPTVTISGGGGAGATGTAIVGTSPVSSIAMSSGGTGYLAPTVTISGGGGTGATATATVGTSPVNSITVTKGGLKYKTPTVNIIPVDGNGTGATATATIDGTGAVTGIAIKNVGSGYTTAPRITITDGPTRHSGPTTATATATVLPAAGSVTGITFTGGSGYTSAPSVTITDATGTGAIATATVSPTAGTVTGITVTGGSGYTSAPSVTISDIAGGTGTGASAKAIVGATAGAVTGITVTNTGTGYTSVPSITIADATGKNASATVPLEFGPGVVTGITITNPGTGYTSVPSITIADGAGGAGTGASAIAAISGTSGAGAQATVITSNSQSIPVRTKAEQELFDTYGRYNSTGGVELHLGSQAIQTTVPLSYIDSPTEIIGDSDTQVWKIVDNGFWSNSMHFDFVDVQLINRVGWDGTVKAPASNEVGWKDTLRLNPLEDVVIAMRARRPSIPFGLPQSLRAQDPSVALGVAGSNLGFIIDPGVMTLPTDTPPSTRLLTTTTNVMTNYDNEYVWNSAILGHSEDDFMRPIVYKPIVTTPDTPANLAQNAGTLTWTDPTPAGVATTLANPKNEVGFIVQRASGNAAFAEVARVPANATSWVDTKQVLGITYSYQVMAYNAMGNSLPSNTIAAKSLPAAPSGVTAVAGTVGSRSITVNWTASPAIVTGYTIQSCQMNTALTACGAWGTVGAVGANITTFKNNTRLNRGRSYRYQVMANAGAGINSAYAGPSNTVVAP